jgi:hypothetical protein
MMTAAPSIPREYKSLTHPAAASVCAVVTHCCNTAYGSAVKALVLTGSMARDEASFVPHGIGWKALGDAEFLVVLPSSTCSPVQSNLQRNIDRALISTKIHCNVTIGTATIKDLERMKPRIFSYELRTMGRVVWGDPGILARIPNFSATEIDRADAWEMLGNRMIEYLEAVAETNNRADHSQFEQYRAIKLVLDTATSFLVFAEGYVPSYQGRSERISALAKLLPSEGTPLALREFARMVAECTSLKLKPSADARWLNESTRRMTVDYARRLWLWELALLAGSPADMDRQALVRSFAQLQPKLQRFIAWLRVLRRRRTADWRSWPLWLHQSMIGSPRLLIYGAAAELFFAERNDTFCPKACFDGLQRLLPLSVSHKYASAWEQSARDVSYNYRELLIG